MNSADKPPRGLTQALAGGEPGLVVEACSQLLAELRAMDRTGALALAQRELVLSGFLEALAGEEPGRAARKIAMRLKSLASSAQCLGCGTCCRTSSPTLYRVDLRLVGPGGLERSRLYTLRAGEKTYSARTGKAGFLERELIKVSEQDRGGGCIYLDGNGCGVYAKRPLQCRKLECWSGMHAGLEERPRLTRPDIFAGDEAALALIDEYELKLPARLIAHAAQGAASGDEKQRLRLMEMVELDHRLRAGIIERFKRPRGEMSLMLGRPAHVVAAQFGLEITVTGQNL